MRILFIGNSITFHPAKPDIGWNRACGMAASSEEKDYVHVLQRLLSEAGKKVTVHAINASEWERSPKTPAEPLWKEAEDFRPDVTVLRLSENTRSESRPEFLALYERMTEKFSTGDRQVYCVGAFWKNDDIDRAFSAIAEKYKVPFVSLQRIQGPQCQATGQFSNTDVCRHPSDKGMEEIARLLFDAMRENGLVGKVKVPDFQEEKEEGLPDITADGIPVPVHTCRVSKIPFNCVWPGHQRPLDQTETAYFATVAIGSGADIRIQYDSLPENIVLRPSRLGLPLSVFGNTVVFTIRRPGYYTVEGNGRHTVIHLFAVPSLLQDSDKAGYTYYFSAGVHDIGKLSLHSGDRVYLDTNAVVYGSLRAENSKDIVITGTGILDGSKEERHDPSAWTEDGLVNFVNCENIRMEGITLKDSCFWNLSLYHCQACTLHQLKIIGQWRYNTDGIDTVNSTDIHISDCFLRTFDDTLVFKGLRLPGLNLESRNVTDCSAENCTLWCDWGGAVELGAETIADEYSNLLFRNIDILRNSDGAMRIHSGDRAVIHDVHYENIYVEYTPYDTPQVLQASENMSYPADAKPLYPAAIRAWQVCNVWTKDGIMGKVKDITYKGIHLLTDSAAGPEVSKPSHHWIWMEGRPADRTMDRIVIEDFTLNGKRILPAVKRNEHITITVNGVNQENLPE